MARSWRVSLESFVLDNDLIGSVLRATRGIEVSEDTLLFRGDSRGVLEWSWTFSRSRADTAAHAERLLLSSLG